MRPRRCASGSRRSCVEPILSGLRIATFHEYCNDLLRENGREFGVLDDQDLWIYLRRRLRELNLNYFVRAASVSKFLEDLLKFMRHCHDELVSPEKYQEYVAAPRTRGAAHPASDQIERRGRSIRRGSPGTLPRNRQRVCHRGTNAEGRQPGHLRPHDHPGLPTIAAGWRARFRSRSRFILVDEFQDVNFAQVKVLQRLAGEERNVFAVGDPDQAIYRFRGASSAAFVLFQRHFPGFSLVKLEKNRRSTSPILNSAFALISKIRMSSIPARFNRYQRSVLISAREEDAAREGKQLPRSPVEAVVLTAKDFECTEIVTALRDWQRKTRRQWSDCAVLYRTHSHRDQLAAELARQDIPFSIENMDVMDMPEARDLFACMGAVVSDADGASLFRVAALPQFAKLTLKNCEPGSRRFHAKPAPRQSHWCFHRSRAVQRCWSACDTRAKHWLAAVPGAAQRWIRLCASFPAGSQFTRARSRARIRQRLGTESHHQDRGDQRASRLPGIFS